MKALVFGGSFDPPHRGHMRMLAAALRHLRPERTYIVPAYRSPLKPGARAPAADRLRMTRLALEESIPAGRRRGVAVEDFEVRRGRTTYTYQTLRHLRLRHPGAEFHFLAGGDALEDFEAWKRPAELRAACGFLIGRRSGARAHPRGRGLPRLGILPGSFPDISSTEVRCRLLAGEDVASAVGRLVLGHIRRRKLYGLDLQARLSRELGRERYHHTVCVARSAIDLALRHGLDAERAAYAALLHDCGRIVPMSRMLAYAKARGLRVPHRDAAARRDPSLLHAAVSADLARRRYGAADSGVLSAIRKHTLGDKDMSPLDRLLYTADACSADRDFPEAGRIRRAARRDLDEGYREAVRMKLEYVLKSGQWLHPTGVTVWNRIVDGT
ncbi:MAG: nicotinate (nicotinamide) nucleotide adenylyltransferase [Elusimicrobiota bacterium]